ncbi:MAG: trichothecene 15-O-acetyltransferase [Geoglossum umbratile]|nr:MAG: trichothecene 15-O-acetyltransferase [Geoglossum umbratile]
MDRVDERQPKNERSIFDEIVHRNLAVVLDASEKNWGLKLLRGHSPGAHMALFHDFSRGESVSIVRAVKERFGPSCTVTHLGHAAMVLAILKLNPPDDLAKASSLTSPCFMNGRRYLRADHGIANRYIPVCQAQGAVVFPNIKDYAIPSGATKERSVEILSQTCRVAMASYRSIRERDSILSESLPLPEYLAASCQKKREQAAPYFLSDSIIEQYIDRVYHDKTSLQETLTVEEIRFSANVDGSSL